MSRFLSQAAAVLSPYTPGEQPQDRTYVKLNTNESPFPPSPKVVEALSKTEAERLYLYSDPTCKVLCDAIAKRNGLAPEQAIAGNGSDELIAFALRAFCGRETSVAFADITYGFYQVWAKLYGLHANVIPLREDFTLAIDDYLDVPETIIITNPNAPTGIAVPPSEIERLLRANRNRLVLVDEAYVDFGAKSVVQLIAKYDNLLVLQTFSKSRSLAGARIGFAMGSQELIADLNRIKYSFNPYNVNRLSLVAGAAAMADESYFTACTHAITDTRAWTTARLEALGFTVLPSTANFVFARTDKISGGELYQSLKENGILVRHFDQPRIKDWCRITIGSPEQMCQFIQTLEKILEVDG